MNIAQTPLGSYAQFSVGRPFYTDLQHTACYAGYVKDDGYLSFTRTDGDPFSITSSRERADAGVAFRVNTLGRITWLVGALTSYERRGSGSDVVIITDSGFVDDDLVFSSNGDLMHVESAEKHIQDTINADVSWWKENATDGVGILNWLGGPGLKQKLQKKLRLELESDGYRVSSPIVKFEPNGDLTINPNATI